MDNLTHESLLSVLHYAPDTGLFTWLVSRGKVRAGSRAGFEVKAESRIKLGLFGKLHNAHRLAWFYMTGEWPAGDVDHRDGNGTNNRWKNLRDVSHGMNMQNERRARKHSSTGLLGVVPSKHGTFFARIRLPGVGKRHLGTFSTPELAHAAYVEAKRLHHEGCTI